MCHVFSPKILCNNTMLYNQGSGSGGLVGFFGSRPEFEKNLIRIVISIKGRIRSDLDWKPNVSFIMHNPKVMITFYYYLNYINFNINKNWIGRMLCNRIRIFLGRFKPYPGPKPLVDHLCDILVVIKDVYSSLKKLNQHSRFA